MTTRHGGGRRRPATPRSSSSPTGALVPPALEWAEHAVHLVLVGTVVLVFTRLGDVQYTLPKMIAFTAIMPLVAGVWIWRASRGEVSVPGRAVLLATAGLAVWWVVSTAFAVHRPTALYGLHGRYNGLWTHLLLSSLFLFVASSPLRDDQLARRLKLLVGAVVVVPLYAIAQVVFGFSVTPGRAESTIGHPVIAAAVIGLAAPFALALARQGESRAARLGWGVVLAVLIAGSAATLSRGPWVGTAVALAFVMVATRQRTARRIAPRSLAIGLVAVCVAVAAAVIGGNTAATAARAQGILRPSSLHARLVFYRAAAAMMKDEPLTGVGFEAFGLLYPTYREIEPPSVAPDAIPVRVHDGYLHMATTSGVPSLLLYLTLLTIIGRRLYTGIRDSEGLAAGLRVALAGALLGYLVQDLTGWEEISLSVYFWLLLGLAASAAVGAGDRALPLHSRGFKACTIGTGMAVALGAVLLLGPLRAEARGDRSITEARILARQGAWPGAVDAIDRAIRAAPRCASVADQAALLYYDRLASQASQPTYARAVAFLRRARSLNPFDPYVLIHRVQLEALALERGLLEAPTAEAEAAVEAVVTMDPNNARVCRAGPRRVRRQNRGPTHRHIRQCPRRSSRRVQRRHRNRA